MIIWLIFIIYILFLLAKELNYTRIYLLTNRRIIDLYSNYRDNYEERGSVYIRDIKGIKKNKINNILIRVGKKNIYLINLEKRDLVYERLCRLYERCRKDN